MNGRIDLLDSETGSKRTIEQGQALGGVFLSNKTKLALVMERQTMLRMAWMEKMQGGGGERGAEKKPRTPKSGRFKVTFGGAKDEEAEEKEREEEAAAARKAPMGNVGIPDFTVEADVFRNAAKDGGPPRQVALFYPGTDYLTLSSSDVMPMLDSITDKISKVLYI